MKRKHSPGSHPENYITFRDILRLSSLNVKVGIITIDDRENNHSDMHIFTGCALDMPTEVFRTLLDMQICRIDVESVGDTLYLAVDLLNRKLSLETVHHIANRCFREDVEIGFGGNPPADDEDDEEDSGTPIVDPGFLDYVIHYGDDEGGDE